MVSVKKQRHAGRMYMIHAYLLIGLALAVAHRELRVDELTIEGHLEPALLGADARADGDLALKLVIEEGGECGGEARVASARSVRDVHARRRRAVAVIVHRVVAAAAAAVAALVLAGAVGAAVAAAAARVHVVVRVRHWCV